MFDSMVELDAAGAAAAVSAAHADILDRECRLFRLAAHWADLHPPGPERAVQLGGTGTPKIAEFVAEEFGARLETTTRAAESMIADALDVRHRLPTLWSLLTSGGVRVWRVRKVAQATRHLTVAAGRRVDQAVAASVGTLPWARFETVLEAQLIAADPELADERARMWEADRFVRASRSRSGLKTIVARALAGDAILFLATVERIAEILRREGDTDGADVRRSTAIGILAQPAVAMQLLWDHRDDPAASDLPEPPSEPGPEESGPGLLVRPPVVDPGKLKPRLVFYVHLAAEALRGGPGVGGVTRFEDVGPVTGQQIRRFLAGTACDVRVQPVIDLNDQPAPVDAYEIPDRLREHQRLRTPASCFPYSPSTSRRVDLDHTVPYLGPDRGGPPGQTRIGNLGPLTRHEHRAKTHSRWRLRQPDPDTWVWRAPYGAHFVVTSAGTLNLGSTAFGRAVWRAANEITPARTLLGVAV